MYKICTSVEQSRKLIKLGIDVNTADMFYADLLVDGNHKYNLHPLESYGFKTFEDTKIQESARLRFIPVWSLSALLELIPPYLGEFNDGIDFGFGKAMNSKWYSAHYLQTYPNGDIKSVKTVTGDTAVDAVFEMIIWLKENNKL